MIEERFPGVSIQLEGTSLGFILHKCYEVRRRLRPGTPRNLTGDAGAESVCVLPGTRPHGCLHPRTGDQDAIKEPPRDHSHLQQINVHVC